MRVDGLLFDLGGTLFSYTGRRRMGGAILDAAAAIGVDAEPRQIAEAWGRSNQETMQRYAQQDYFLHRDLFRDTLSAFATHFERTLTPDAIDAFEHSQRQAVIDNLPIRDDCHDTLEALKSRGLYLSIVSNIDDDYLDPLVAKHGLDDLLDHWTSSEEARSCKPHTGIYH
jgi:FMN phosphatase YigB (HAD superfamily)